MTDPAMSIHTKLQLFPLGKRVTWALLLCFLEFLYRSGASQERRTNRMSTTKMKTLLTFSLSAAGIAALVPRVPDRFLSPNVLEC